MTMESDEQLKKEIEELKQLNHRVDEYLMKVSEFIDNNILDFPNEIVKLRKSIYEPTLEEEDEDGEDSDEMKMETE
ncbi:hypothetical protein EHI8A_063980 [Entamoeba histolytica HM-1:IMSS-B]|uniref:Coiled-coil protein n=3 Tax=Entamoeba histolytica TaxID=5759 RepID=A0A175JTX1_ENTHI|nr:hypothetical protein EHI8A_063980 [Entamoeba histolytica HM-1:IMSS-B]ENY62359.1 unknown protein, putative [Entamoeba histolytica HM-1:IMSS-A]GAT96888.1 coiled-coil protein [Entamoeba histolytica]